jgi:hypothetical protein
LGVFADDTLPDYVPKEFCLIVNTDKQLGDGTHWQGVTRLDGTITVFCSLASSLSPNLLNFVHCNSDHVIRNTKALQPLLSTLCGSYCIAFLYFTARKVSLKDFLEKFAGNTESNDQQIMKFMRDHFKMERPKICVDFLTDKMTNKN